MAQINVKRFSETVENHAGAVVRLSTPEQQLQRMVMASMMFEDQFYLDGVTHHQIIKELVRKVDASKVEALAIKARLQMNLRHIPLVLCRELARIGKLKADTLTTVVQRPDEITEFVAQYWQDGKQPLSNQVKKGLANCFYKFSAYQFAKYNQKKQVTLRDVLFLTHAKPCNQLQEKLFKNIADNTLQTPDTWEVQLSAGKDKCDTFTNLMLEKKLGALAFIRNLRNMVECGVDEEVIRHYGNIVEVGKVLPFRFIAAARIVPQFEDLLESMMFRAVADMPKLPGKTVLLVDVSGSMFGGVKVSKHSDLGRFDAAAALAILCRELCEQIEIYTFSNNSKRVAPRRGFALVEALKNSQFNGGTCLGTSVSEINQQTNYDRMVVFTDEQSTDIPPKPLGKGYIINVASYQNGINHKQWLEITGFSERVFDFIQEVETL